ncbi:MAG: TlpA disulfide reductase family protein [Ferruginibacter sp.]
MKKYFLLPLLVLSMMATQAQVSFDALKLSTPYPKALQNLNFSFNPKSSPLKAEKNIEIVVYEFTSKGLVVKEPILKNIGGIYNGTVLLDSNANVIAFGISSGETKDNNSGKGFIVPVYNKNNEPVKGYYVNAGQLYAGYGEYLFGMASEPQKNMDLLETGLSKYPELEGEADFYTFYLNAINIAKKTEAKAIILEKLKQVESKPVLSESNYTTLANWYTRLKIKEKADSLKLVRNQKFPAGAWVRAELMDNFYKEKSAEKKAAIYEKYIASAKEKMDENMVNNMKSQVADAYNNEKNTAMFTKWSADLPMGIRAASYNNVSWYMAEKDEDLPGAKKMSEAAVVWAKQQVNHPTEKKPLSMTTKQWNKEREGTYSMYGDTYAYILYKTGDYKTGLTYAKDAATIRELKAPEYNERYAMLLEKAAPAAEAKTIIEGMVKAGKASPKTKEVLKALYAKEHKSEGGFDSYLATLEADAKIKRMAEIRKSMQNNVSPKFVLKDWEGKEVSLESLKGKVVVVDFWATWCGPCIASMPGMKKAQEKLAGRDDVKFLFVDTWESVDNKLENSKDFMKKKNYPFYVLMDNDNKMVGDFGVNGIPTKFIIDKDGNIRFKSIGFEGNTDVLADEVIAMVEMAAK